MSSENKMPKGLIISRQIGSGRAFKAWLEEVPQMFDLEIWYYASSAEPLSHFSFAELIEKFSPPSTTYDFVIAGTSLDPCDYEVFLWAKSKNIPSIAFVDQWINYEDRFSHKALPDYIFAVDAIAQSSIKRVAKLEGVKDIFAAGSPALSYLNTFWSENKRKLEKDLIVFATEPASYPGGDIEHKTRHGIYDLEQLALLISAISIQSRNFILEVLLHPIDKLERVQNYLKSQVIPNNLIVRISTKSKKEIFCSAEIIFGMRSFLLFESSKLGIRTVSLQIGRTTFSELTDGRDNIEVIKKIEDLSANVFDLSSGKSALTIPRHCWNETILKIVGSSGNTT